MQGSLLSVPLSLSRKSRAVLHSRTSIIQPKVGFPLGGLAGQQEQEMLYQVGKQGDPAGEQHLGHRPKRSMDILDCS